MMGKLALFVNRSTSLFPYWSITQAGMMVMALLEVRISLLWFLCQPWSLCSHTDLLRCRSNLLCIKYLTQLMFTASIQIKCSSVKRRAKAVNPCSCKLFYVLIFQTVRYYKTCIIFAENLRIKIFEPFQNHVLLFFGNFLPATWHGE